METRRCYGCMNLTDQPVCPVCGWSGERDNAPHQLKAGTVLRGQYTVGRVLGQGGFGITYLGWDRNPERVVAIKEFFPSSMVNRDTGRSASVSVNTLDMVSHYEASKARFLREANALALLADVPEIVGIYGCFEENNTAYIVMEFIQGVTLADYVREKVGKLSAEETLRILKPVMQALDTVHRAGLVHRDISPDNIMLHPMGGAKILDFGAVREVANPDVEKNLTRSTEAIVKHGFAPMEQYRSRGGIGPWTDEYALCATVYFCMTGKVPPDAVSRSTGDERLDWTGIPGLPERQRLALEKGAALSARDRYPSVGELALALYGPETPEPQPEPAAPVREPEPQPEPVREIPRQTPPAETPRRNPPRKRSGGKKWLIPAAAALALLAAAGLWALLRPRNTASGNAPLQTCEMTMAEGVLSMDYPQEQPFWGQTECTRESVELIRFQSTLKGAPRKAWDVSRAKDGSVRAWMQDGTLYVAANGKIAPNPDASQMFAYFTNLRQIDFGDCFDTSGVTHMRGMFAGCRNLTGLDLSGFDTSQVTAMGEMFYDCAGLTELDLSGFDTSQVTDMGCMFSGCGSLTGLNLSGFDTSRVWQMGSMFSDCGSLTALNLSGFDTTQVTNMGAMFYGCGSLRRLDVSGFHTSNTTGMVCMFAGCSGLTELDLSGFDTSQVTNMASMFSGCSGLTELELTGFDTANVTDMSGMFSDCGNLTALELAGFDTTNVTDMSGMFRDCDNLTALDLSGFRTSNVTDMFGMFVDCASLRELNLSGFDTANVTDMGCMFSGCGSLTGLNLSGFNTSNVTKMTRMFMNCGSLTSLDLSGFDTSGVTDMRDMFRGGGFTGLYLSGFRTGSVTDMSGMFANCQSLRTLYLSGFDTSGVTDMSGMFSGCGSLTSLDLSGFDASGVTNLTYMFHNCGSLTWLNCKDPQILAEYEKR